MKFLLLLTLIFGLSTAALAQTPRPRPTPKTPAAAPTPADPTAQESAELNALAQLPVAERVPQLAAWLEAHPDSTLRTRAGEALVSARAAWGDELLKSGAPEAGLQQFQQAVQDAPAEISDVLFARVLAVLPSNLYVRGQREAAVALAQEIEKRVAGNAPRLLPFVTFYLSLEDSANAERLAAEVVKLAPESAAAHQALGAAQHIGLKLEAAATEYEAAYKLAPDATTRRSWADLLRANGAPDKAIPLYQEQLAATPEDRLARAGLILAMLDAGQRETADQETAAALAAEPRNLALLAGLAYWFVAHGENALALDYAQRAVQLEPRYTWAQVALARALLAQNRPFEAANALRFAQQYGNFPTLNYELATVLASVGLYDEAATELTRGFGVKDGNIGTLLAGRQETLKDSFTELLAPERRAGLFQPQGADNPANARQLKNLLLFYRALYPAGDAARDENAIAAAAFALGQGTDGRATYRQLYAASRLRRLGLAPAMVSELMSRAPVGVENALDQPFTIIGLMADDWANISRSPALANPPLTISATQRATLSRLLRGRIEEMAGWAYLTQGNTDEAAVRFRRALSVLPENTSWWRSAQWQMGIVLETQGKNEDALNAYMSSYNPRTPDAVRYALIARLYRQLKGSDEGLDKIIGPVPAVVSVPPAPAPETRPTPVTEPTPAPTPDAAPAPVAETTPEVVPVATPAPEATPGPVPTPEAAPTPEVTPAPPAPANESPTPEPTPTPAAN